MKKSFYLKYLDEQKNKDKKLDVNNSSNFFLEFIKLLGGGTSKILKSIFYILLTILVSTGLTALLNPSIRNIFVNLFNGGLLK